MKRHLIELPLVCLGLLGPLHLSACCDESAPEVPSECSADGECEGGRCESGHCVLAVSDAGRADVVSQRALTAEKPPHRAMPFVVKTAPDGACTSYRQCSAAQLCVSGKCEAASLCTADSDCAAGANCDGETRRCRPSLCKADSECNGNHCVRGRCQVDKPGCGAGDCKQGTICDTRFGQCESQICQSDEECAGPRICERNRCLDCRTDGDCPGKRTCDVDGVCVPSEMCDADADCDEGTVCGEAGECVVSPCLKDGVTGREKRATAPVLTDGEYDRYLCQGSSHYYAIDLDRGQGFQLHVAYDPRLMELDLRFYTAEESAEQETRRAADDMRTGDIAFTYQYAPEKMRVWVRIYHRSGGSGAYRLGLDLKDDGNCVEDRLEPNDSRESASPMELGKAQLAHLCDNPDWFRYDVTPGQEYELRYQLRDGKEPTYQVYVEEEDKVVPIEGVSFNEEHKAVMTFGGKRVWFMLEPSDESPVYYRFMMRQAEPAAK